MDSVTTITNIIGAQLKPASPPTAQVAFGQNDQNHTVHLEKPVSVLLSLVDRESAYAYAMAPALMATPHFPRFHRA